MRDHGQELLLSLHACGVVRSRVEHADRVQSRAWQLLCQGKPSSHHSEMRPSHACLTVSVTPSGQHLLMLFVKGALADMTNLLVLQVLFLHL